MDHTDDFITSTASVKIEQPRDRQRLGIFYFVLLFLSFVLILMTHFVLILEGIGRSLPTFLKFPVA